jgi:GT2 family glycosyltransferase
MPQILTFHSLFCMIIKLARNSVGRNDLAGYSISLSVVTYNNDACIEKMLDSLYEYTWGVPFQLYVINNGPEGSVDLKRSRYNNLTLIQSEKNIGFGSAHNKILDKIDSKYHVIINPDVFIDYDVIKAIADYMDRNDDIGIITPMVKYPDGRIQALPKRDPKFKYLLSRRLPLGFLKKYRDEYEMAERGAGETFDVEFATGCFMFIRTELFKKVCGFDERFFLYFEDADLSRKIREFARVQYNPQFYVYHSWQRAGAKNLRLFIIQVISMFKYFAKWKAYRGTI